MNDNCMNVWEDLYRITVLREETRRVEAYLVRYRFCVSRFADTAYYAEIFLDEERAAAHLGKDLTTSQELFERLVNGVVTPCTLLDIMQDIKNAHSPLQV